MSPPRPKRSAPGGNARGLTIPGGVEVQAPLARFAKLLDRELRLLSEAAPKLDDARWMILLDVYRAMVEGREIPFMSAAHASRVPVSTAQRYIHEMVEARLMVQHRSAGDQRVTHVSLSDQGFELVTRTLCEIMTLRARRD